MIVLWIAKVKILFYISKFIIKNKEYFIICNYFTVV